jgi:ATP-dependent DNA helicase Rep
MLLNPQQRAAVEYCAGPLLVLAGAGSGKTRVITEKVAHLIARQNVEADRIAAITFTNKAAREMRDRLTRRLNGVAARAVTVCTFHALGLTMLQREPAAVGLRRGFSVLDADETAAIIKDLAPPGTKPDRLSELVRAISWTKNAGLAPEEALARARTVADQEVAQLYAAYQRRLRAFNAVDFDDLLRLPLQLLRNDSHSCVRWQERLRYLLVDEYQDTNAAQYALLKLLAGRAGAFTVVGDDDQSIYAWRGANPDNLAELTRDYPTLKTIVLEQNYRCTGRILRAANRVIAHNTHLHEKRLWSEHEEGPPIRVLVCRDDAQEAERVVADLLHQQQSHRAPWHDFAILYRGNHQSRPLEKALRLARVPYHLSGGTAFLERSEIKDLLAYLRLIVNPDDDAAFLRVANVPRREIGAVSLEKLAERAQSRQVSLLRAAHSDAVLAELAARPAAALAGFAGLLDELTELAQRVPAAVLVREIVRRTGYAEHLRGELGDETARVRRLANLEELADWFGAADAPADGLDALAARLALLAHTDRDDAEGAVRLMTLHAAKGLEFRFVWLIGLEQGVLPHESSLAEGRLEEERRLFYVGITRARQRLCLSYATSGRRQGERDRYEPSRFLAELPPADLHWDGQDAEQDARAEREVASTHLARIAGLLAD